MAANIRCKAMICQPRVREMKMQQTKGKNRLSYFAPHVQVLILCLRLGEAWEEGGGRSLGAGKEWLEASESVHDS